PLQGLRPRIGYDRVHERLSALPGSRLLATSNAGTIADRGVYPVYLGDGKTRVGELDEEFVYETRVGNTFLLGSQTWRVLDIQNDRVIVGDAAGAVPRMPFWHGDQPWRTFDLGVRIGKFRNEIAERIRASGGKLDDMAAWLKREFQLDENSTQNLLAHVRAQLDAVGVISSDQVIVVEKFEDAVGSCNWVIHSPFGGRVNGAWALALSSALRERMGLDVESQTNDDGILFRFPPPLGKPPTDIVREMSAAEARERIVRELPTSAMFGAHFRMNAARALLLPKSRGHKRTPFWLQRLKAKDLLAVVRQYDDFPIVAETYRDCLRDVLDLPHLEKVLTQIADGSIQLVPIETIIPSPIANGLLLLFQTIYQYEWDTPKAERDLHTLTLRRDVLDDLLGGQVDLSGLLKPAAIAEVNARAQHSELGARARTLEELALYLYGLGDLSDDEIADRSAGNGRAWIGQLAADERAIELQIPTACGLSPRWVHIELRDEYARAFTAPPSLVDAEHVLRRLLRNAGPLTHEAILNRYAFDPVWLDAMLEGLVASRELVRGH
ncbi:MAG: DEAD/DEAH box helicase, partial [Chloroflexi bacterium]|nr:DEAD/DEAH box helicase [Chloroflexota bacterium]